MNQNDISAQIIANLAIVEPDLDTSVGVTIRKMIDAFAEQIAEAYADNDISTFQYSVDAVSGSALDDYLSNFGFQRFQAKPSTGSVTFSRPPSQSSTSPLNIIVMSGTSLSTTATYPVLFQTLITTTFPSGQVAITIPVVASIAGSAGNVPSLAIQNIQTPLRGISGVANALATSGGTDAESDSVFRARFKTTVFRGFLGTEASFNGTVLENTNVTRSVTIGSALIHQEQLNIINGTATSVLQDYQYIIPYNQFLQDDNSNFLNLGVDWSLSNSTFLISNPTIAPTLAAVAGTGSFVAATNYSLTYCWLTETGATAQSPAGTITEATNDANVSLFVPTPPTFATGMMVLGNASGSFKPLVSIAFNQTPAPTSVAPLILTSPTQSSAYTSANAPTTNTTGTQVIVTSLNSTTCPDGIYELQLDYVPYESRNNINSGITNRVDIYTDGSNIQTANQVLSFYNYMSTNVPVISPDPTSPYYFMNYTRQNGFFATIGNLLIPLSNVPVYSLPATINAPFGGQNRTLGANATFALNTDYWQIENTGPTGGSNNSIDGIEWLATDYYGSNSPPAAGSTLQLTGNQSYEFNALPQQLEVSINQWGFTNQDIWLHQATPVFLNFNLVVILQTGQSASSVSSTIAQALSSLVPTIPLGGVLETSAIISAVTQVIGVQTVRFATSGDATAAGTANYAIQSIAPNGTTVVNTYAAIDTGTISRAVDVILGTTSYAVFNNVSLIVRSQNSYRNYA
jgi:uncharacterized phage protein gp47/JayE